MDIRAKLRKCVRTFRHLFKERDHGNMVLFPNEGSMVLLDIILLVLTNLKENTLRMVSIINVGQPPQVNNLKPLIF